jgi:hypothetical protein
MITSKLKYLTLFLLACFITAQVNAGSQHREEAILPIEDIAAISKKVEKYAAEQGARVFFMARQGRPTRELPDGVNYTHVSYAVYSTIETKDGRAVPGYAIYNLYQLKEDPSRSNLVVDFPLDFLAGAHAAKVGVIIPKRSLQKRILEVINSDSYEKLHNPAYSAISNPYNARYQNCTEHVLDVLNAAIYQTDDIKQLKINTQAHFDAQKLKINPFKLFLASLFMSEVKTSDHKKGIKTTTFGSIANYLQSNGLAEDIAHIEL